MKNVFIVSNEFIDPTYKTASELKSCLEKRGCRCAVDGLSSFRKADGSKELSGKTIPEDTDLFVVLGGDGTLMEATRFMPNSEIPVFGINTGTLGYLTEVGAEGATEAVGQIIDGNYITEQRILLNGTVRKTNGDIVHTAVNDIVLARYGSIDNINIQVRVNDSPLCAYRADGVILSTPTGSTAYNMSAGGPIATPTASLILMTPVAPHNLTSRSIVFSGDDTIELTFLDRKTDKEKTAEVSFDGNINIPLNAGDSVVATKSDRLLKIIRLNNTSFMEILHQKLV